MQYIRGLWKVNSRWIGEDRNSKDCQTDGEFTFFCCFISVSLDLDAMQPYTWKWALGPLRPPKKGELPEKGALSWKWKGTHNAQRKCRNPVFCFIWFCFLFSMFCYTPAPKHSCGCDHGGHSGSQQELTLYGRKTFLWMVAPWPQEGETITFFSFSILLLLGPGCKHSHTSIKQKEVTNDSARPRTKRGSTE